MAPVSAAGEGIKKLPIMAESKGEAGLSHNESGRERENWGKVPHSLKQPNVTRTNRARTALINKGLVLSHSWGICPRDLILPTRHHLQHWASHFNMRFGGYKHPNNIKHKYLFKLQLKLLNFQSYTFLSNTELHNNYLDLNIQIYKYSTNLGKWLLNIKK